MLTARETPKEKRVSAKQTKPRKSYLTRFVEAMPPDSAVTLRNQTWGDYEKLLDEIGEASGLRISFNEGTLEVMTLSIQHEYFKDIIKDIVRLLGMRKRIRILTFGSATMKNTEVLKGAEPDGCFYVQTADKLPPMIEMDFSKDPPPDVVVEIDIHHKSESKNPIYAALGVSEIWRYNGKKMTLYKLGKKGEYTEIRKSAALPILTAEILTEFLNNSKTKDQYEVLLSLERWLETV